MAQPGKRRTRIQQEIMEKNTKIECVCGMVVRQQGFKQHLEGGKHRNRLTEKLIEHTRSGMDVQSARQILDSKLEEMEQRVQEANTPKKSKGKTVGKHKKSKKDITTFAVPQLPVELLVIIFGQLSITDLFAVICTSKTVRSALLSDDALWYFVYRRFIDSDICVSFKSLPEGSNWYDHLRYVLQLFRESDWGLMLTPRERILDREIPFGDEHRYCATNPCDRNVLRVVLCRFSFACNHGIMTYVRQMLNPSFGFESNTLLNFIHNTLERSQCLSDIPSPLQAAVMNGNIETYREVLQWSHATPFLEASIRLYLPLHSGHLVDDFIAIKNDNNGRPRARYMRPIRGCSVRGKLGARRRADASKKRQLMIQLESDPTLPTRRCPQCHQLNVRYGNKNRMSCWKCESLAFCYICGNRIEKGHYRHDMPCTQHS